MRSIPLDEIVRLVELQLGRLGISADDHLTKDLGAESVDVVNLVAAVEEKFGVFLKESEIAGVFTPHDLHELISRKLNGA